MTHDDSPKKGPGAVRRWWRLVIGSSLAVAVVASVGATMAGSTSNAATTHERALMLPLRPGVLEAMNARAPSLTPPASMLQGLIRHTRSAPSARSIALRPTAASGILAQADATFDDSLNDNPGGLAPDVSQVAVVNDTSGNVGIAVAYNNRPTCVGTGDYVFAYLDVDQNPATGAQPLGIDFALGIDGTQRLFTAFRWDGANLQPIVLSSLQAACDPTGFNAWLFNGREVGIGTAFNFAVAAVHVDSASNSYVDLAPNSGVWNYQLSASPTPPPPPPPSPPPPPPPPADRTFADAPRLPKRARYTGPSVRHAVLAPRVYSTMKLVWRARQLQVACWSEADWDSAVTDVGGNPDRVAGVWFPRQRRFVHVAPVVCRHVQALVSTRRASALRAVAATVLLHEGTHLNGVRNEAEATCYAVQLVYYFARRIQMSPRAALSMERLAVRTTRLTVAPSYWDSQRCRDGGQWDLDEEGANLSY